MSRDYPIILKLFFFPMLFIEYLVKKVYNYKEYLNKGGLNMLNIKHPEADRLARLLAKQLDESITDVVIEALREKLLREQGKRAPQQLKDALLAIGQRCAALPDQDKRPLDDILGYDSHGLPQ